MLSQQPGSGSGQRPAAGIQQMEPVPAPLHWQHILFSREYYFSPNKHNFCFAAKKPCLFLLCITVSTFVGHVLQFDRVWHVTRVPRPGTGADVIKRFPLPQNICSRQPGPEWVCQVQKFVGAGAGYICGPQLLGYRSLQWVRDTWSGPGGSVNITHVSPIQHSEIKLNVKSFNIISHRIHYADNLVVIQGGVGSSPPQIFRFW